jgi:hypothetical protein
LPEMAVGERLEEIDGAGRGIFPEFDGGETAFTDQEM